ncbi:hypothetical protein LINPERHAP1_LOCUS13266, partial [Linum perenne]
FNSENNFLHSHIHITLVLSIYQEEEPLIANWASTRTLPSRQSKINRTKLNQSKSLVPILPIQYYYNVQSTNTRRDRS